MITSVKGEDHKYARGFLAQFGRRGSLDQFKNVNKYQYCSLNVQMQHNCYIGLEENIAMASYEKVTWGKTNHATHSKWSLQWQNNEWKTRGNQPEPRFLVITLYQPYFKKYFSTVIAFYVFSISSHDQNYVYIDQVYQSFQIYHILKGTNGTTILCIAGFSGLRSHFQGGKLMISYVYTQWFKSTKNKKG